MNANIKRKEILDSLINDTKNDKIKWEVQYEESYLKSNYKLKLTDKKNLNIKVLYFVNRVKHSKVIFSLEKNIDDQWKNKTITELGGKKNRDEVYLIEVLIEIILYKRRSNVVNI